MHDLAIIGAGPAGLTASIYASCYRLNHFIMTGNLGGQMATAPDILNYPGFNGVSGKELTDRMVDQVKSFGGEIVVKSVMSISHNSSDGAFTIKTADGETRLARAVLLATGTERRRLNVPGELEYIGRGVHYCATCEKFDYEGKVCGVVGGANAALQAAVQLSHAASKVYVIYRGIELRGDAIWLEQVRESPQIEVLYGTVVKEIKGDGSTLTGLFVENSTTKEVKELPLERLFIEIGGVPGTALVAPLGVSLDPGGYIHVDERMQTSIPGLFAAGDLVTHAYSIEQISTAVGLGARACASVFAYLKGSKAPTLWGKAQIQR
jgi:thioredoxin-disulfide reductase